MGATGTGNNTVVAAGATLLVNANISNVPEAITLNGNGLFGLGALQGSGAACSVAGGVTLANSSSVAAPNPSDTFTITNAISETGGSRALTKSGSGTLILSGANTYTGGTTISAGTLLMNGSAGNIQLSGGTLGGIGTVGSISGNGAVSPGASVGILNANGNVTFGGGTAFNIELNGATVGSQYDKLNVTGSGAVNLGGANLVGSLGNGFNPTNGTQFTILQTTGTITGQFAQGNSVTIGGRSFGITYNSNGVVLTALLSTATWDGGGADSNWTTAANWVGDLTPFPGDNLVFPDNAARKTNTNDFAAGTNFGSLTFTGNDYFVSGNALTLSNGIIFNTPFTGSSGPRLATNITLTQAQTFSNNGQRPTLFFGTVNLNGFALTVDGTLNINLGGQVTGAGSITRAGTETLFLSGSGNNYTGATQVNTGSLRVETFDGLGATGAGNNTNVAAGATLGIGFDTLNVPETITLNGDGDGFGGLRTDGCPTGCSISGPISLAGNTSIGVFNNEKLTISSGIVETGGARTLTKVGSSLLTLAGANTYSGGTTINAGTLLVNGSIGNVKLNGGTLGGTGTAATSPAMAPFHRARALAS